MPQCLDQTDPDLSCLEARLGSTQHAAQHAASAPTSWGRRFPAGSSGVQNGPGRGHPWLALAARICESQGPGTHPQKKEKEPSPWMAILAGLAPGAVLVSGGEAPFRDRPVAMNDSP